MLLYAGKKLKKKKMSKLNKVNQDPMQNNKAWIFVFKDIQFDSYYISCFILSIIKKHSPSSKAKNKKYPAMRNTLELAVLKAM